MAAFVARSDLDNRVTAATVDRIFDHNGDGVADNGPMNDAIAQASNMAQSILLNAFTEAQITQLATEDLFKFHVSWLALELGGETRAEWLNEEGKGRYYVQFQRAEQYFKDLVAAHRRSTKEATAGKNPHAGGKLVTSEPVYVFTPTPTDRKGPGGF